MRISAINQNRFSSYSKFNQNFKGLWGKSLSDHYEDSMYSSDSTVHYYYPFKDESQNEIDKVVNEKEYNNTSCADPRTVYDPITCSESVSVSVQKKLPFTKNEFYAYLDNPKSTTKRHIIESEIMKNDLEEHIHY